MINIDELAICKCRGHNVRLGLSSGWVQRKWCGTRVREVCTIEEREDTPSEDEQNWLLSAAWQMISKRTCPRSVPVDIP
jgi:hypothetical protein